MSSSLEWFAKFFGHLPVVGTEALLFKCLQAALLLAATYVLSRLAQKWIEQHLRQGHQQSDAAIATYQKVCRYALWAVGVLFALHAMGMDLSHLFTTSGLFAIAIGFGLRDVAGNYVAGLIIKANDSIKYNDILEMDGRMVRVKRIGVHDTIVRTKDGLDVLIPNAVLTQGTIGNYTLMDSICRVITKVGVSYASDLKQVSAVLQQVVDGMDGLSDSHPPRIILLEFGDSAVIYRVTVTIDNPWNQRAIQSQLNEAIWWALKDSGIAIAIPQLDVHLDKGS